MTTSSAYIETFAVPQRYAADAEVQTFCELGIWNFNRGARQQTAHELVAAACQQFGPARCGDLCLWLH